jgi:nitrogen fixation NifU-like protein
MQRKPIAVSPSVRSTEVASNKASLTSEVTDLPTAQEFIDIILDHQENPRNMREMGCPDLVATGGNPGCGDIITMYAVLDSAGAISAASFQGDGCTVSLAAASILTEQLVGLSLAEVDNLSFEDVAKAMGPDVVATRTRCATLALSTVKRASARHLESASANAESNVQTTTPTQATLG